MAVRSASSAVVFETVQRRERVQRERLAEHGRVAEQPPLFWREPVEAGRDQCMQGLRHLERVDLAQQLVARAFLHEQATIKQHPYRFHRIQRHALGTLEDLLA